MYRYVGAKAMAERWNISVRQVQMLCSNGKIENAAKFGHVWTIPVNTPKPTRTGKYKPGRKTKNETVK